jgi:hypothetical protein
MGLSVDRTSTLTIVTCEVAHKAPKLDTKEATMGQLTGLDQEQLAAKVAWEGGVLAALEYGIRSEQIANLRARELWRDLESRYAALTPLVDELESYLARQEPEAA